MTKLNLVTELKEVGLNNIQIGIFDSFWRLGCVFFHSMRVNVGTNERFLLSKRNQEGQ